MIFPGLIMDDKRTSARLFSMCPICLIATDLHRKSLVHHN